MQKSIISLFNSDQLRIYQLTIQLGSTQKSINYPTPINAAIYQLTIKLGSTQKSINSNEVEINIPCPDANSHWIQVNVKRSVISDTYILISKRYPV